MSPLRSQADIKSDSLCLRLCEQRLRELAQQLVERTPANGVIDDTDEAGRAALAEIEPILDEIDRLDRARAHFQKALDKDLTALRECSGEFISRIGALP